MEAMLHDFKHEADTQLPTVAQPLFSPEYFIFLSIKLKIKAYKLIPIFVLL
jgi:hypothetical protein